MVRLGLCALQAGTPSKTLEGARWLEKAADLGDPEAKNNIGCGENYFPDIAFYLANKYISVVCSVMKAGGHAGFKVDLEAAHALYLEAAGEVRCVIL